MTKRRALTAATLGVLFFLGALSGLFLVRSDYIFDHTVATVAGGTLVLGVLTTIMVVTSTLRSWTERLLPLALVALFAGPLVGVLAEAAEVTSNVGPDLGVTEQAEELPTLTREAEVVQARCDDVADSVVVDVTTMSQETAFPNSEIQALDITNGNLIGGGQTLFLEPVDDSSLLVAAVTRQGPYKTDFYLLNTELQPTELIPIHTLDGLAVFDLLTDSKNNDLLYSYATRSNNCLRLGVSAVPRTGVNFEWTKTRDLFETTPCLNPLIRDALRGSGRLAQLSSGEVLFAVGEMGTGASTLEEQIQRAASPPEPVDVGVIYALNPATGESRILSRGHRNPQGLVVDMESGNIWSSEHGPWGGDEVNLIVDGSDYGWDYVTYGRPYDGLEQLSDPEFAFRYEEATRKGIGLDRWCSGGDGEFVKPEILLGFDSIAPSQLILLNTISHSASADAGTLVMGTLRDQSLWSFEVSGDQLRNAVRVPMGQRFRDLVIAADANVYLSTDSGQILRVASEDLNFQTLL